ncbi:MAG: GNAT family N-acetyltransferase [Pseudomonadota bacterium]
MQPIQNNLAYRFVTPSKHVTFVEETIHVFEQSYPKFLAQGVWTDPNSLALFEIYPEFQFGLVDTTTQQIIAQANCLPLAWENDFNQLPDEGCDWALAKGFEDHEQNRQPNTLCLVSIAILPAYQGKNLSQAMIHYMQELAQSHGLNSLIMAARPSLKSIYPLIPIESYITWQDKNGRLFDPWLRMNIKQGAKLAGICSKSTTINDTIDGWENRAGMKFPETGNYIISNGLVPVKIDATKNRGIYVEPNVWLYYKLS